jgi:hypothetical protein
MGGTRKGAFQVSIPRTIQRFRSMRQYTTQMP